LHEHTVTHCKRTFAARQLPHALLCERQLAVRAPEMGRSPYFGRDSEHGAAQWAWRKRRSIPRSPFA
jgi:hypothetical protein